MIKVKSTAGFYPTLSVKYNGCPEDCSTCETVCPKIKAVHLREVDFHGIVTCVQCGEPECVEVCPTGAIAKSQVDGVVRIDEEKCVGCGLCTLACPYAGMYYEQATGQAIKCDRCDGEPECCRACEYDVVSFIETRPVVNYLSYNDVFRHGSALCMGCPAELAARTMIRVYGDDTTLVGCPGCAIMMLREGCVPAYGSLFTNVGAVIEGLKTIYRRQGKDTKVVAFVGDGAAADAGFQSLSGAAERGQRLIYICYDNEAYMNTGIQRSGTTPHAAWTFTTPVGERQKGKSQGSKYMPLIMAFHDIPYVATASIAYLEDYVKKLIKAKEIKNGMAYIHLLSPCPVGWRAPIDSAIEMSRIAVQTNYFPLWESENGRFRFTYQQKNPKPVREFTKLMGRFSHFAEKDLEEFQEMVDRRFARIQGLVQLSEWGNINEDKG